MEEVKEEKIEVSPRSSKAVLYSVFVVILLVAGVGAYFMNKGSESKSTVEETNEIPSPKPAGPVSMKGQKFSDTDLFSQAVQIYPGTISESAKATMSGWNFKTKTLTDGTVQADLIPVGSEATEGDTAHTFVVKTGYKLYFVDLNPSDDGAASDQNTHDDLGILVDSNGIIQ
jgi:hypothetical protein